MPSAALSLAFSGGCYVAGDGEAEGEESKDKPPDLGRFELA